MLCQSVFDQAAYATVLPDSAGDSRDSAVSEPLFFTAAIRCMRPRYTRVGLAFTRGIHRFTVPQDMLEVLRADPCLDVLSVQPSAPSSDSTQTSTGSADVDGDVTVTPDQAWTEYSQ